MNVEQIVIEKDDDTQPLNSDNALLRYQEMMNNLSNNKKEITPNRKRQLEKRKMKNRIKEKKRRSHNMRMNKRKG